VITLQDLLDECVAGGVDGFLRGASSASRAALVELATGGAVEGGGSGDGLMLCADCGRRGHGRRFIQLLLERPGWRQYATQVPKALCSE
jgi:hypothetical protein